MMPRAIMLSASATVNRTGPYPRSRTIWLGCLPASGGDDVSPGATMDQQSLLLLLLHHHRPLRPRRRVRPIRKLPRLVERLAERLALAEQAGIERAVVG